MAERIGRLEMLVTGFRLGWGKGLWSALRMALVAVRLDPPEFGHSQGYSYVKWADGRVRVFADEELRRG